MRKICLFTTLGLILISQVQAEKIKAWIILDSDTIEVTLDVSFDSFSQDPDYEKLQKRIKYIDATGKEMTLRPEEAREVQFTYKGEDIRMVSRRNTLRLNSPFSSKTYVFLKLEIDGELQMFTYFSHAIGAYNPSTGGMMGGGYATEGHILQKRGGELKLLGIRTFRKDMIDYFSDCPALVKRIDEKEFRKNDVEEMVHFFNSNCR